MDMASNGGPSTDQIKLAIDRTRFLMHVLRTTGLMYKHKLVEGKERAVRMARAIILINLVGIHLCYSTYYIFVIGGIHRERSVVVLCWLFQSFMSMCLLVWWQYTGRTRLLIHILPWEALHRSRLCTIKVVFYSLMCMIISMSIVSWIVNFFYPKNPVFDRKVISPFDGYERYFGYTIVMYAYFAWAAVFTMYSVVLLVIQEEIVALNKAVEELGSPENEKKQLSEQLLSLHDRHARLCYCLQQTDKTFEVYNFIMFTTNIPTTIFSLLACYDAATSPHKINLLICLPEMIFCVVEILGLATMPAKISATLETTERLLYSNRNLWRKYDQDLYVIIDSFIKQNRQPGLGMSIWGFAIVSKSLILTTASLVITYLTLLVQMSESPGQAGAIVKKLLNSSGEDTTFIA